MIIVMANILISVAMPMKKCPRQQQMEHFKIFFPLFLNNGLHLTLFFIRQISHNYKRLQYDFILLLTHYKQKKLTQKTYTNQIESEDVRKIE